MDNLPFAIWMVGYAFAMSTFSSDGDHEQWARSLASITNLVIWVYVGQLLYVKPEKKKC